METPKVLPKDLMGRQTTQEQWDQYQLDLKNHNNWCDSRQEFAERIIKLVQEIGPEKAFEKISREIYEIRFMDAPNEPGYYRANND